MYKIVSKGHVLPAPFLLRNATSEVQGGGEKKNAAPEGRQRTAVGVGK